MISQHTKTNLQQYLLLLLLLFVACLAIWATCYLNKETPENWPVLEQVTQSTIEGKNDAVNAIPGVADPCTMPHVTCEGEKTALWRTVTAYNTVPEQTDGSPCIAANGTDICKGMAQGKKYVATNELAFGTKVKIAGEVYEVVDRTNSRYAYRYDIAMPAEKIQEARNWGVKNLEIEIL